MKQLSIIIKPKYLTGVIYFIPLLLIILLNVSCKEDLVSVQPDNTDWQVSSPEAQEMNAGSVESAFTAAQELGYVDALLVIRNGYLVGEKYFNGYNKDKPHNLKSVSKSFLSVIAGIAYQQGYIQNLDEPILNSFPEYVYQGMDQRKFNITIRHLLTMQMGIESESLNGYQVYMQIYTSSNWIKTTIEMPLVFTPGQSMKYNTFETHLLATLIARKTGKTLLEYARTNLFDPMGITIDAWEQDPQGNYFGGNSMFFTPREMAKLGAMYMQNGKINDLQVISGEWVDLSVTPTRPLSPREWGVLKNYNYGYLWWLGEINHYKVYMALGYGGQFVLVFPALNLIVVATSNGEVSPDTDQELPILKIVSDWILPAVK